MCAASRQTASPKQAGTGPTRVARRRPSMKPTTPSDIDGDLPMTDPTECESAKARLLRTGLFSPDDIGAARLSRLGGLTNRNYRVDLDGQSLVLRIPGEGTSAYIDRAVEKHNAEVAARAGVNAEVLHFDAGDGVMVCRYVDSATMDAERFRDLGAVGRAAHAFRRMHEWSEAFESRFDLF